MKNHFYISRKLKAFTLMELAVGMLLTTVTVAAGFSMYLYFIKTIKKHATDEERIKNLQTYYFQMEKDLENTTAVFRMENGIIFLTRENGKIIYRLEDTLLLREIPGTIPDTFKLYTSSLIIPEQTEGEKITEFSIGQRWNKKEIFWQWKKEYSPVESINQYIISNGH